MNKVKYIVLTLSMIFGIGLVVPAVANATITDDICAKNPQSVLCPKAGEPAPLTLMDYVINITNTLLFVLGAISVVMIIYAGITYTTSAGDSKGVEKAKGTITYAVIGLVVALLAGAIVNFVLNIF